MGEDVKGATEGIEFERLFNEDAQAVYRLAKVYGLPAEVDLLYLATRVHQYAPWLAWFRAVGHAGAGSDDISRCTLYPISVTANSPGVCSETTRGGPRFSDSG